MGSWSDLDAGAAASDGLTSTRTNLAPVTVQTSVHTAASRANARCESSGSNALSRIANETIQAMRWVVSREADMREVYEAGRPMVAQRGGRIVPGSVDSIAVSVFTQPWAAAQDAARSGRERPA